MNLPKDPYILLSFINTKLRNEFHSLEELCITIPADKEDLASTLSALGYIYSQSHNQFIHNN